MVSITPSEADSLHRSIAASIAQYGRHSGGSIANQAIGCFKFLYDWAAKRDDSMPRNPVRLGKGEWHRTNPNRRPIPLEKLSAFYAAVMRQPPIGRDLLLVLLYAGYRREEAQGLRWDEIDFGQRVICLPPERNKSSREFVLPMSDLLVDLLWARRQLGHKTFVFPSYGHAGHITNVRPWIDTVGTEIEHRFSAHDLRRTFLSIAETAGISRWAIRAMANHAIDSAFHDDIGSDITAIYVEKSVRSVERLREAVEKVANRIKELCNIASPDSAKVAMLR
jgi:integrase